MGFTNAHAFSTASISLGYCVTGRQISKSSNVKWAEQSMQLLHKRAYYITELENQ